MKEHEAGGARRENDSQESVGRRGVLAWAATLAGAGLAWLTGTRSTEATHLATGTAAADNLALHVDQVNDGTQRTFLVANVAGSPSQVAFNGVGGFSIGFADGLQGITTKTSQSAGVRGRNHAVSGSGSGVTGEAFNNGVGVTGIAGVIVPGLPAGVGVYGFTNAPSGVGVRGGIATADLANTIAVYGENFATNPGPSPGAGGFGVYGFSAKGHGLVGATGTLGGAAVVGSTNGVVGAHAGVFYGDLVVVGGPKSAAVPVSDGSLRLLYCVESPESWFEDFGSGNLERGCADVTIKADFAEVADMSDYHVFLTPYGRNKGLHVAARTPTGFAVEEEEGGRSEIAFAWRVVARRKDIKAERLAKVVLPPEPKHPTPPTMTAVEPKIVPAPKRKRKPKDPEARPHTHPETAPHAHPEPRGRS
jgi:hypothetical protein